MIPGLVYDFNTRLAWSRCYQRRAMAVGGKWECGGLLRIPATQTERTLGDLSGLELSETA